MVSRTKENFSIYFQRAVKFLPQGLRPGPAHPKPTTQNLPSLNNLQIFAGMSFIASRSLVFHIC